MVPLCPRCEATLPPVEGETALFCWNCGLPQLRVAEPILDAANAHLAAPTVTASEAGTGDGILLERPPLRPVDPAAVDWPALLPVLLIATAGGLLPCFLLHDALFPGAAAFRVLFLLPLLCLASGFAYARRRPARRMGAAAGAQMGLALGTLLALAVVTLTAISSFALRYGRHDRSLAQTFDRLMQQFEAQMRATQPATIEPVLLALRTPEWHAGFFLAFQGVLMVLLIVTGLVAGTVTGVLLRTRDRAAQPVA